MSSRAMDDRLTTLDPAKYDESNQEQFETAMILLDIVRRDERNFDNQLMVDAGCGSGNVTLEFVKHLRPSNLIGFDLNEKMVQFCCDQRDRFTSTGTKVAFYTTSFEDADILDKLQIEANTVDLLISSMTFHWVKDKLQAIRNTHQMLRPGGRAYILGYVFSQSMNYDIFNQLKSEFGQHFTAKSPSVTADLHPTVQDTKTGRSIQGLSQTPTEQDAQQYYESLVDVAGVPEAKIELINRVSKFTDIEKFLKMIMSMNAGAAQPAAQSAPEQAAHEQKFRDLIRGYLTEKQEDDGTYVMKYKIVLIQINK